jgi:hypothetical protein
MKAFPLLYLIVQKVQPSDQFINHIGIKYYYHLVVIFMKLLHYSKYSLDDSKTNTNCWNLLCTKHTYN